MDTLRAMRLRQWTPTGVAILALMAPPMAAASHQGAPAAGAEGAGQVAPVPAPAAPAPPDEEPTNTFVVLGVVAGLLALAAGLHVATGRAGSRKPPDIATQ